MINMEPKLVEKLTWLWKEILKKLKKNEDSKKIAYFFSKCGIINIDEKNKIITLWAPNTFVQLQIKKLFYDKLEKIIKNLLGNEYKLKIETFAEFQNITHPLLINLNEILWKTKSKKTISKEIKKQLTDKIWILFEKQYTFENFVVWPNNEIAYKTSYKVAQKPGQNINPLFIRWDVWLWKTHLLQAIWNYIISHYPSKVIVYLPTTKFIDEIMHWLKKNNINSFFEKINQVDILILDDIQFLGEKFKTQEIFHNIFNDLYAKWKQIILSSDRPPKELNLIESRLTSRFSMGMIVKIEKPNYETRKKIIIKKLKNINKTLDEEYIEIIAKIIDSNIRELLWAVNNILNYMEIYGNINTTIIYEILKNMWFKLNKNNNQIQYVNIDHDIHKELKNILTKYNITLEELKSNSRKQNIIKARSEFAYVAKNKLWWTLQKIGDFLWWKNHATILHYIKNYKK